MFIENLRHAKNKGRLWVGILMGLIVISLVATFAYVGSDYGVSANTSSDYLTTEEDTAKSAASAAKADDTDMDAQGTAASAYLSLAIYQDLYLEDNTKSYEKALEYGQAMVTACASADEPDYETAYGYEFTAYQGLADADSLSSAFNESLDQFDITESYLDTYYSAMSTLGAYDQFVTDMESVTSLLNDKLAEEEAAGGDEEATDDEDADSEDSGDTDTEDVSTSDLIDYVATLVSEATAASTSATTED